MPPSVLEARRSRAQPGVQLFERERLDEVVVRAGVEARDPVADGVARGQHQDGRPVVRRLSLRQTSSPSTFGIRTSSTTASGVGQALEGLRPSAASSTS